MNIQEYSNSIKKRLKELAPTDFSWRHAYEAQGYYSVLIGEEAHLHWNLVHRWCEENVGREHYSWTGSRFWFEKSEDAVMFSLRWS